MAEGHAVPSLYRLPTRKTDNEEAITTNYCGHYDKGGVSVFISQLAKEILSIYLFAKTFAIISWLDEALPLAEGLQTIPLFVEWNQ